MAVSADSGTSPADVVERLLRPVVSGAGAILLTVIVYAGIDPGLSLGLFERSDLPRSLQPWIHARGLPFGMIELVVIFLFGLMAGSMANVVIHRAPDRAILRARAQAWLDLDLPDLASSEIDRLEGYRSLRSRCPHCRRTISLHHLVPVVSWLLLGGRAACCHRPIPIRYPVVEGLVAISVTVLAVRLGHDLQLPMFSLLLITLVVLAAIDLEQHILPDHLVLPLLGLGLLVSIGGHGVSPSQAILGLLSGFGLAWLARSLHQAWSGRIGIGLGDCKLSACLGAWSGLDGLLHILPIACLSALLVQGGILLIRRDPLDRPFPLGPWLAGGAVLWLLAEEFMRQAIGILSFRFLFLS